MAAHWAGFETVGQCEWADYPTKVLEKHWPHVPRWRDIRTLTGDSFHERTGLRTVDIVSGGFPCQPFSIAGQRRGKADDRYLWDEMLRVIGEIRPTWVVGENVAGLTSMAEPHGKPRVESRTVARYEDEDHYQAVLLQQEDMLLNGILEDLSAIGYDVRTFVIPACGVDAQHQRYRIAIVAHTNDRFGGATEEEIQAGWDAIGAACGNVANPDSAQRRTQYKKRDGLAEQPDGLQERAQGTDRPECSGKDVPDAKSNGCDAWWAESERQQREAGATDGGEDVANANDATAARQRNHSGETYRLAKPKGLDKRSGNRGRPTQPSMGISPDGFPRWLAGPVNVWACDWDSIPRIAIGVKDRVAKLKTLGNAVVPQQFYPIFDAIYQIET